MSLRQITAGLVVVAALIVNIGCCCHRHKHHGCCSTGACNSCYASPASRTSVPNVPGNP